MTMKHFVLFLLLLTAACSGGTYNGYDSGYNNLSQSLDNLYNAAQKVKDAQNEYKRYDNEGDDYLENRLKDSWEDKKNEYQQRRTNLKAKSERLKQDFRDIRDNW